MEKGGGGESTRGRSVRGICLAGFIYQLEFFGMGGKKKKKRRIFISHVDNMILFSCICLLICGQ